MALLGDVITEMNDAAVKCESPEDMKKLQDMAALFKDPKSLAYKVGEDLIWNHVEVYNDVSMAISDYKGEHWGSFGMDLGKLAQSILTGNPTLEEKELDVNYQ